MSAKQELSKEDKDSTSPFDALNREIVRLQRENKGLRGQNAKLKKEIGQEQVKLSPEVAQSSQTESAQVPSKHITYSFMRDCPECGGKNESFKAPNVFCNSPECKGVIPLGTIDLQKDIEPREGDKAIVKGVEKCWNCGAEGDNLRVVTRSPKAA